MVHEKANTKKPYKGVIKHWALINNRIYGRLLDSTNPLDEPGVDIATSEVVTIIGYESIHYAETKNSRYILF